MLFCQTTFDSGNAYKGLLLYSQHKCILGFFFKTTGKGVHTVGCLLEWGGRSRKEGRVEKENCVEFVLFALGRLII